MIHGWLRSVLEQTPKDATANTRAGALIIDHDVSLYVLPDQNDAENAPPRLPTAASPPASDEFELWRERANRGPESPSPNSAENIGEGWGGDSTGYYSVRQT